MRKFLLISFMLTFAFCFSDLLAQERTVSGKVTSTDDGSPLPGVNVVLQNTTIGTVTDIEGNYSLSVPTDGGTLVFSFIGLTTEEVSIGSRSVINLEMSFDITQLSEVVVTAFGIEREKKVLTYSVQEVEGQRIAEAGTPNAINALQGKIAGVQVNQSSGMPGSSSFIRIRGSNSFSGNNQPLMVVDGMPIESNASSSGSVSGTDYSSRALDINPDDIASINVLKGASAAALYGTRASNGVVLITTKNGKNLKAGTSRINVSQSLMVDQVSRLPDLQSRWAQGSGGVHSKSASTSWGPLIENMGDPAFNSLALGDGSGKYVNNVGEEVLPRVYDNVSPFFDNGVTSVTNLDLVGATEAGSYSFSMGYTDQTGIIPGTGMNKINGKVGGEFKVNNKFTTGASLNFIFNDIDKLAGGSNLSNSLFTLYWAPRSYDLWGTPFATEEDPYDQIHYRGSFDNPRWGIKHNSFNEKITRSFGSTYFNYKPLEWLHFNYRLGVDAFTEERKEVYGLGSGNTGGSGQIVDRDYTYRQVNSNFNATIAADITEDLFFDVLLGNEVIDIRTKSVGITGSDLTVGGFDNISNTASQTVDVGTSSQRTVGFYANATFSFKEYLFLNLTGRQDYVSNMPSGNRTFFYPSVGANFVFTDAFDLSDSFISFGKIRASYAEVGQPGPINSAQIPFVQADVGTGFTNDGIQFPFNGVTGFEQSNTLRDPNLVPQNSKTMEFGLQTHFLKNRIGVDVTYFEETTTDQIFTVPLATSTGYSSILRNAGELSNKGIEAVLTVTPVKTGSFNWDIIANFTQLNSEVVSLAPGVDNIFLGGFVTPNVRAYAGEAYPVIFGSAFLRNDEGRIVVDNRQFIDGVPNQSYGMPVAHPEAQVIGNVNPDFEVGLSNSVSYKDFRLDIHVDMRKGGQAYAGNTRLQKLYGQDKVTENRDVPVVLDAVKGYYSQTDDGTVVVESEGENDIAILPGQRFWSTAMDAIDEASVYDTDFVRLREVRLTYNVPAAVLQKTFIKGASVYFMGRNLLLLTDYPNFDPETSVGGAGNFQGLEYVNLPQTKSIGGGIRLTF